MKMLQGWAGNFEEYILTDSSCSTADFVYWGLKINLTWHLSMKLKQVTCILEYSATLLIESQEVGWPQRRRWGQTALLALMRYGRWTWSAGGFCFGWTPAEVSADFITGALEFTANPKCRGRAHVPDRLLWRTSQAVHCSLLKTAEHPPPHYSTLTHHLSWHTNLSPQQSHEPVSRHT